MIPTPTNPLGKSSWKPWTQPVLVDNGTPGGDAPTVRYSRAYADNAGFKQSMYQVFSFGSLVSGRYNTSPLWGVSGGALSEANPAWIDYYSPVAIRVSAITCVNPRYDYGNPSPLQIIVYGSHDGAAWAELAWHANTNTTNILAYSTDTTGCTWDVAISSPTAYKWHRFAIIRVTSGAPYSTFAKIYITATQS